MYQYVPIQADNMQKLGILRACSRGTIARMIVDKHVKRGSGRGVIKSEKLHNIKILAVRVYFECQSGSMQDLNREQTVQIRVQL